MTIVLSRGAPIVVRRAGKGDLVASATVAGLTTSPVDIVHDGTQKGVQLELTPFGARALLGVSAGALALGVFCLEDLIGRRAHELTERVLEATNASEQAVALNVVLEGWRREYSFPVAVETVWRRLAASRSTARIGALAADTGLGRRHLSELVRAELGVSPKGVARILRFVHARAQLVAGPGNGLAQVAAVCGYFDQAHLTNDWKRLAGCTPGEWMRQELPFLQDTGGEKRAQSVHHQVQYAHHQSGQAELSRQARRFGRASPILTRKARLTSSWGPPASNRRRLHLATRPGPTPRSSCAGRKEAAASSSVNGIGRPRPGSMS